MTTIDEAVVLNRDHDRRVQELIQGLGAEWFEARRAQDEAAYRDLLSHVPIRGRTLELGAGTGAAYPLLMEMEFRPLIGLELLPEHAQVARRQFGYDVRIGAMERPPFQADAFDVVVSRHSLEHTSDPPATLAGIWKVLKAGGYTAHAVPATSWSSAEPAHLTTWWWASWRVAFMAAGFVLHYARYQRDICEAELHMVWRKPVAAEAA